MTAIDPDELQEVLQALQHARTLLDELVVRGVRAAGPAELGRLDALREELGRVGARHLAEQLRALSDAMRADDPAATGELLCAQTSLYLFDRILTLRVVEAGLVEAET
jgi:hypothetical protein